MFFVSFFLSGRFIRGHACECADFDSGVDDLPKRDSIQVDVSVVTRMGSDDVDGYVNAMRLR